MSKGTTLAENWHKQQYPFKIAPLRLQNLFSLEYTSIHMLPQKRGVKGFAVTRFCSIFGAVLRKFYFTLPYCRFTKPGGLRYLEIFGWFQCCLRFSCVILCGVYTYFCTGFRYSYALYAPLKKGPLATLWPIFRFLSSNYFWLLNK